MFAEQVKAWNHGPVVKELWELHKGEFDVTEQFLLKQAHDRVISVEVLHPNAELIVNAICQSFGSLTGWQLRNRTHTEEPWKNHFDPNESFHDEPIPNEEMAEYYARA